MPEGPWGEKRLADVIGAAVLVGTELNTHADRYDGVKVKVRGWLVIEFEKYYFWDSKEALDRDVFVPGKYPKECVTYLGPIDHPTSGRMETLAGTYWRDFGKSLNAYNMGTCNISGLDVTNATLSSQQRIK